MGSTKYYAGEELSELFKKDSEFNYIIDRDLIIETVKEGIIYPIELSETKQIENREYGGVCDCNNNLIELSQNHRTHRDFHNPYNEWYIGANPNTDIEKIPYIDEDVVFIGAMHPHFGHFLFESLSRLWFFLNKENKKYKAAYILYNNFQNFKLLEMLELFGIEKNNLICVKEPTKFRNVIIPEASYTFNDKAHANFRKTIEKIKQNVLSGHKKIKINKKVFFSKKNITNNRAINEENIAKIFAKNGYKIVEPEKLSLKEYILLMSQCSSLVCTSATNAHNSIFLPDNSEIIVLNRSNHVHYIQTMIDQLFDLNTTYIECHKNLLPVSFCLGPFLIAQTKYLEKFLDSRKMKYKKNKQVETKLIFHFLKVWASIYKNPDCFIENNGKEYVEKIDLVKAIESILE